MAINAQLVQSSGPFPLRPTPPFQFSLFSVLFFSSSIYSLLDLEVLYIICLKSQIYKLGILDPKGDPTYIANLRTWDWDSSPF